MDRAFVTRLGLELRRRGMNKHVEQLRLYWRGAGAWTDEFVNHLGAVLQVEPFARTIPVHQDDGFVCCQGVIYVSIALDDRTVTTCHHCKGEWLSFHASVAAAIRQRATMAAPTYVRSAATTGDLDGFALVGKGARFHCG